MIAALLGWVSFGTGGRPHVDRARARRCRRRPDGRGSLDAGVAAVVLPFVVTASFAMVIVIARHRKDVSMMPATCASQVLVVLACAPFVSLGSVSGSDWAVLAALGVGQMGLGLAFLTIGARLDPTGPGRGHLAARGRARADLGVARLRRAPCGRDACRRRGRRGRSARAGAGWRPARAPRRERGARLATRRQPGGSTLPGFMIPFGSKSSLDPTLEPTELGVLALERIHLADPDPVLAGHVPPRASASSTSSSISSSDARTSPASSGSTITRHEGCRRRRGRRCPPTSPRRSSSPRANDTASRELGERDADVRRAMPLARGSAAAAYADAWRAPRARARRRVALHDDVGRTFGLGDRGDELEVGVDGRRLGPAASTKSDGPPGKSVPRYALIAAIVHASRSSHRVTPAPAATIAAAARHAASTSGNDEPEDDRLLRNPLEAERQLGDHAERPLGADRTGRAGRIRPTSSARGSRRGRRGRRRARPRRRARSRASSRSARVVVPAAFVAAIPPSVASAPGSTGKKRPCSAAARSSAVRVTPGCTVAVRSPGETSRICVHPRQVERDPALDGDHVPLEARSGGERRHRDAMQVGERQHRDDVLGRGRVDDDVGPVRPVERDVARVQLALGVAVRDPARVAERVRERVTQIRTGSCGPSPPPPLPSGVSLLEGRRPVRHCARARGADAHDEERPGRRRGGWFVVNARDSRWREVGPLGSYCSFEGKRRFPPLRHQHQRPRAGRADRDETCTPRSHVRPGSRTGTAGFPAFDA